MEPHIVKLVRKAAGESQACFAKSLGISSSYLQKVELGDRPFNQQLCEKLYLRTGLNNNVLSGTLKLMKPSPEDAWSKDAPRLKEENAKAYLWLMMQIQASQAPLINDDAMKTLSEVLLPACRTLFEVAHDRGVAPQVALRFLQWMRVVSVEFGIRLKLIAALHKGHNLEFEKFEYAFWNLGSFQVQPSKTRMRATIPTHEELLRTGGRWNLPKHIRKDAVYNMAHVLDGLGLLTGMNLYDFIKPPSKGTTRAKSSKASRRSAHAKRNPLIP